MDRTAFFDRLQENGCSLRGRLSRYAGSHLLDTVSVSLEEMEPNRVQVTFGGATWECSCSATHVDNRPDAIDLSVSFKVLAGHASQCSVGLDLNLADWSPEDYVLVPGAVYNGNRFQSRAQSYPPRLKETADLGPGTPIIVSDVPRLNLHDGLSRIQLLTGDGATPAVGVFRPRDKSGFWLLTPQATEVGDSGLTIEESADRGEAVISVTAPGVRQDTKYTMCTTQTPSDDQGVDLAEGQAITLHLRLDFFPCRDVQHLFDRFAVIRKDLTGPVTLFHELPFSEAWRLMEEKQNRDNWWDDPGFYAQENGRPRRLFGTGWGGGGIVINYPLLMNGNETSRERVLKSLDFFFTQCVSPAGFFHDHHDGRNPLDEQRVALAESSGHLVRRDCEALYALIKQFQLLEKQTADFVPPDLWLEGTRRCADALLRQWQRHGQLGQCVDVQTGEIIVGGGTNGGLAPAALARVSQYFGEERYLQGAEDMASLFHEQYVQHGLIHGGTRDALKSPDSESAFALLDSFVTLYEVAGERHWVTKAEETARQCASWCVSYDFAFPPEAEFGRLNMHTAGAIYPNAQNKHAAPGICTLSGDSLLRLFRATGDLFYLELLREIAHNLTQYVSRPDRPITSFECEGGRPLPSGWMNERVNMSDWEGKENVGGVFYGSCWSEIAAMLTCAEVPGLYVQPDTGLLCAIDHIDAEVVEQGPEYLRVRVTNPTKFPARVRVLCENSVDMKQPLPPAALWDSPQICLGAGESQETSFSL